MYINTTKSATMITLAYIYTIVYIKMTWYYHHHCTIALPQYPLKMVFRWYPKVHLKI